ncbi:MAG: hypothetical protein Q8Q65_00040 [bacterium]|nr:hypothetical protein [bacterium]
MREHLTMRPLLLMTPLVNTPLTVSTVAVTIPSTWIPNGTSSAWLGCDSLGGGVKFAFGSDPSTIFGMDLVPGQVLEIRNNENLISNIKLIRATATDGKISFLPFCE